MSLLTRCFDAGLTLVGALAWAFAAFVIGSRLASPTVGGLLAVALLVSALAFGASSFVHEARMSRLSAGVCPRCGGVIAPEHRHRRWNAARSTWEEPSMSWECGCGYAYTETWACPTCPAAT